MTVQELGCSFQDLSTFADCYASLTSVVSVTDCRLLVLEQAAFRRILEDYPVAKDRLLQMSLR